MNVDKLPAWAKYNEAEKLIEVKPDEIYPLYLKKLGWDKGTLTQTKLECARRCFTEDLNKAVGGKLHLRILRDEKYKLSNFPEGKPVNWRSEHKRIS
jgi:hypothetical protein